MDDLKTLPLGEVQKQLGFSPDGLTQAEATKRLAQYGPNEIAEKKSNPFLKFLSYFWGPIPWMIEVAVILSGVVGHWPDFFIILLLLVANAGVGFWEEREAGNAIAALKARLAINARVKREGKWINPPARELVPGDVIRLRLGDIVPADARLLAGDPVEIDRSALTIIQTLIYLKMSVGKHFKIFVTRTRGPFWSIRPAPILLVAVFATQIVATLIAVYGVFMPPIGWGWALLVWGYSLPFFLLNDRIKMLAYRILDPARTTPTVKTPNSPIPPLAVPAV